MLNTIVTSSNFKNFAKTLSRKSKPKIPLSKAHEILAQTFSFKNHYELQKAFEHNSYVDIIIDVENYKSIAKRFCHILNKFEINISEDSAIALFISVFGLESNRKMSIEDILNEIKYIGQLPDTKIYKLMFMFGNDTLKVGHGNMDLNIFLQQEINTKKTDEILEQHIVDKYPKLNNYIYFRFSFLEAINSVNPSLAIRERFLFLLNELSSFTKSELIETFEKNKKSFVLCTHNKSNYIMFLPIKGNDIIIDYGLFRKSYIIVEKDYTENFNHKTSFFNQMLFLYESGMHNEYKNKTLNRLTDVLLNSLHNRHFKDYDSAIKMLSLKPDNKKYIVIPVYRSVLDEINLKKYFLYDEYFGFQNKKLYQYSMHSKTKKFL